MRDGQVCIRIPKLGEVVIDQGDVPAVRDWLNRLFDEVED